jgi:hypothetical protein
VGCETRRKGRQLTVDEGGLVVKRTVFVLTVATFILLVAQPAIGQAIREKFALREIYKETIINECTGEEVLISGKLRIWNKVVQTPSGIPHFKGQTTFHGNGVGTDGQHYVYNYVANHQGPVPDTGTITLLLVNQGSGSDFHVKSTYHISPHDKLTFNFVDPKCLH